MCTSGADSSPNKWLPMVDDVSRLNATEVERFCQPRCKNDVKLVLAEARQNGFKVAMRGTHHSMGGQSIPGNSVTFGGNAGYVMEFNRMNHVSYDEATELVTCGPGATWADLIVHLNRFGKAPRTMQSYSSFSVGGTLSVNGHGITTDHCVSESVVSFTVITADGEEILCTKPEGDASPEEGNLWNLVLGGYGMFGVVVEVTMKTTDNVHLYLEYLQLDSIQEFSGIYGEVLKDEAGDIEMKIARFNICNLNKIDVFIFRRDYPQSRTVSKLGHSPEGMSLKSKLLYKWVLPTMREARGDIERIVGSAIDMPFSDCERNEILYTSADSLAELCSPLLKTDDTFVLQEYFVPLNFSSEWIERAKPIYDALFRDDVLLLLNTTLRFCRSDTDQSFLSYARRSGIQTSVRNHPCQNGMMAFVLYYRLPRSSVADQRLKDFGDKFIGLTLSLGGTFYLPYRRHYSSADMLTAYPNVVDFFQVYKQKYDPMGLFDSLWFRQYGLPLCSPEYQSLFLSNIAGSSWFSREPLRSLAQFRIPIVPERRFGFYKRLLSSHHTRKALLENFLTRTFHTEDPATVMRHIAKAVWITSAKDVSCPDIDVYRVLIAQAQEKGPLAQIANMFRSVRQLSRQKNELARQTVALLSLVRKAAPRVTDGEQGDGEARCGIGTMSSYVSIGDHGKIVVPLCEALKIERVWIVNEGNLSEDMPAVLERGSLHATGDFVSYPLYSVLGPMDVPSEVADLVTLNQGLHHLPQDKLHTFLEEVFRILRPGGVFILREHDASPELMDVLDLAHSIFNAFTGVAAEEESNERRAFRPVMEWRAILEHFGFVDALVYEMEPGDVTVDEMLCFVKPTSASGGLERTGGLAKTTSANPAPPPPRTVQIPEGYLAVMNEIPPVLCTFVRDALEKLLVKVFPYIRRQLEILGGSLASGLELDSLKLASKVSLEFLQAAQKIVENFSLLFERAKVQEFNSASFPLHDFFPPELFLIPAALKAKASREKAAPSEILILGAFERLEKMMGGVAEESAQSEPSQTAANRIDPEQLLALLSKLAKRVPELQHAEEITRRLGLTASQSKNIRPWLASFCSLLREMNAETTPSEETRQRVSELAAWMDPFSWTKLSEAFETQFSVSDEKGDGASNSFPELKREAVLGVGPLGKTNVWHLAAVAFLGSPRLTLTSTARVGASLAGLGDFVKLFDYSQKEGRRLRASDVDLRRAAALDDALYRSMLGIFSASQSVEMDHDSIRDLEDVAEVISATFGYTSITARPVDVTDIVKKTLRGTTLRLTTGKFMGNAGQGGLLDNTRAAMIGAVRKLKVTYVSTGDPQPEWFIPRVEAVLSILRGGCRVASRSEHSLRHAAPFTWFKQNEWMQVEIVQHFGAFMEHTPWFRYPFLQLMGTYFSVLLQEVKVVMRKHGIGQALASEGFMTSLVPGIVMGFGFASLQALSQPIKFAFGESYEGKSSLTEELVVLLEDAAQLNVGDAVGSAHVWKSLIDTRIAAEPGLLNSTASKDAALWILTVPTFKPLTEILKKVARRLTSARVLEISGQSEVQMRVSTDPSRNSLTFHEVVAALGRIAGCQVMFDYQFPPVGGEERMKAADQRRTEISLCVMVPYLLHAIRCCTSMCLEVVQVYDFWCG
eukprot:TRINITY_DN34044_c0_g1_i1.p1 TRINITY_DN34044_c0_g1~~TRINITY_DN34044_c0_g1_i1.p1  ORF type:complete len:1636 (-),score=267.52 TRINITY_DN34044_c0_g1_i1:22-4929(-)